MQERGRALPKFGDWDVNNPSAAQDFSVIFNKARNERKTGANKIHFPPNHNNTTKCNPPQVVLGKSHYVS